MSYENQKSLPSKGDEALASQDEGILAVLEDGEGKDWFNVREEDKLAPQYKTSHFVS